MAPRECHPASAVIVTWAVSFYLPSPTISCRVLFLFFTIYLFKLVSRLGIKGVFEILVPGPTQRH